MKCRLRYSTSCWTSILESDSAVSRNIPSTKCCNFSIFSQFKAVVSQHFRHCFLYYYSNSLGPRFHGSTNFQAKVQLNFTVFIYMWHCGVREQFFLPDPWQGQSIKLYWETSLHKNLKKSSFKNFFPTVTNFTPGCQ